MGHYRKKPYKKKSLDVIRKSNLIEDYIEELDSDLEEDDLFVVNEIYPEETKMIDEPEIVSILRQEELEGKLPVLLYDSIYGEQETSMDKDLPEFKLHEVNEDDSFRKKNMEETFLLAKKALEKVDKKTKIIFNEE